MIHQTGAITGHPWWVVPSIIRTSAWFSVIKVRWIIHVNPGPIEGQLLMIPIEKLCPIFDCSRMAEIRKDRNVLPDVTSKGLVIRTVLNKHIEFHANIEC